MDALSEELHGFLTRFGKDPGCVSGKVAHYVEHVLRLVYPQDEELLKRYYGLFGHNATPLDTLAEEQFTGTKEMTSRMENSLRKIAVSPEWQMIKQLVKTGIR